MNKSDEKTVDTKLENAILKLEKRIDKSIDAGMQKHNNAIQKQIKPLIDDHNKKTVLKKFGKGVLWLIMALGGAWLMLKDIFIR